ARSSCARPSPRGAVLCNREHKRATPWSSSVSRAVFWLRGRDDPAVSDKKASLRDRNDIAKRCHPVLQGSPTATHPALADVWRATAHVDRQFATRYQACDSPREIRRVGGGLRSSETQRQFICAG